MIEAKINGSLGWQWRKCLNFKHELWWCGLDLRWPWIPMCLEDVWIAQASHLIAARGCGLAKRGGTVTESPRSLSPHLVSTCTFLILKAMGRFLPADPSTTHCCLGIGSTGTKIVTPKNLFKLRVFSAGKWPKHWESTYELRSLSEGECGKEGTMGSSRTT